MCVVKPLLRSLRFLGPRRSQDSRLLSQRCMSCEHCCRCNASACMVSWEGSSCSLSASPASAEFSSIGSHLQQIIIDSLCGAGSDTQGRTHRHNTTRTHMRRHAPQTHTHTQTHTHKDTDGEKKKKDVCRHLVYTHTHTHARTHTHNVREENTHTHARAHTHTKKHTPTHTPTHTPHGRTPSHRQPRASHARPQSRTPTHTHTSARLHAGMHAHLHETQSLEYLVTWPDHKFGIHLPFDDECLQKRDFLSSRVKTKLRPFRFPHSQAVCCLKRSQAICARTAFNMGNRPKATYVKCTEFFACHKIPSVFVAWLEVPNFCLF